MPPDATSGRERLWKNLYRMHVCKVSICTYVKNWNIYQRYMNIYEYMLQLYIIWKTRQSIVLIQYQCNLSVSSPWTSISTNFYFITCSILTDYDSNRKKQLIWHWKVESQKMLHQVEKSYLKTLYIMHLCENIHCEICKKLKEMWKISIKISFSHTNIYIYTYMHTCNRYASDVIRKHIVEFVRQYDMQCCS